MKKIILAVAVAALAVMAVASSALAGGGTGITATAAATKTFDGGNTSATFVRAASGIINETNRVGLKGTTQNPWTSADVWVQFRPLTGPTGGTSLPTPNPTCDPVGLVTSVSPWSNGELSIGGDATKGYFIGGNSYNVCVYLVHNYTLTLLADNQSSVDQVDVGHHIVYTGTAKDYSNGVSGAAVSFDVWAGAGCVGSVLYGDIPGTTTNASGGYTFDGGPAPAGVYSVKSKTANATSNCVTTNVGQTATLNNVASDPANTWACDTGATGGTATSGTVFWFRDQTTGNVSVFIKGATTSTTFDIWVEQNPGTCAPGTSSPSNPSVSTDSSGNASFTFTPLAGATNFWLSMWTPAGSLTGTQVLRSVAVTL